MNVETAAALEQIKLPYKQEPEEAPNQAQSADFPRLEIVTAASLAISPPPPRPWLVQDMIPRRNVTLLSGDGGVGKSLLAMQLGVAAASATDWIGTMPEPGAVTYLSAEDDRDEIHRRLALIAEGQRIELGALAQFHIVPLAGKDAVLGAPNGRSGVITATPLWNALKIELSRLRPVLLIIDNLADVFGGNEISRSEARQFVGMLRGVAIEHDCAVILLAHPSLSGLGNGSGTSGSTAWHNSVRSRLYLERPKAEDDGERDPDLRILTAKKANYAGLGDEIRLRWHSGLFRLEGGKTNMFDRAAAEAEAEAVFLDLLASYQIQGRDVSSNKSSAYAPAVFAKEPKSRGLQRRAIEAAMNRLFTAGRIQVEKHGPPSKQRSRIVLAQE